MIKTYLFFFLFIIAISGCNKSGGNSTPSSSTSFFGGESLSITKSSEDITIYEPKTGEKFKASEILEGTGESVLLACRAIEGVASRGAINGRWTALARVKGGGRCDCTKETYGKSSEYTKYNCKRMIYVGGNTTTGKNTD